LILDGASPYLSKKRAASLDNNEASAQGSEGNRKGKRIAHQLKTPVSKENGVQIADTAPASLNGMKISETSSIETGRGIFAGVSIRFWTTAHMKTLANLLKQSGALINDTGTFLTDYIVLRLVSFSSVGDCYYSPVIGHLNMCVE